MGLRCVRQRPTHGQRADVVDHLAVARPRGDDRLPRTDASRARVTSRAEPVVLRRTGGTGADASVGGAVVGPAEHLVDEDRISADDGRGETLVEALEDAEHRLEVTGIVFHHHLQRTEHFGGDVRETAASQGRKRHLHGRRFDRSVASRDGVVGESLAPEQHLAAMVFTQLCYVPQQLVGGPSEHRTDGQVVQLAPGSQASEFLDQTTFDPAAMNEQGTLGRALLSGSGEDILVALPGDVLQPGGVEVGAEDLPVVAGVLAPDAAMHGLGEQLIDDVGTRELEQPDELLVLAHELASGGTISVHQDDVLRRQTAGDHQAQELLHDDGHARVALQQRQVAHGQGAQQLQRRDLQREVERSDDHHRAEGPAVATRLLAVVITRYREPTCHEAHVVAGKVGETESGHLDLAFALLQALGHAALDQPGEECGHDRIEQSVAHLAEDLTEHDVARHVVQRVVPAVGGAGTEVASEVSEIGRIGVRDAVERFTGERIGDVSDETRIDPLTATQVTDDGVLSDILEIDGGEGQSGGGHWDLVDSKSHAENQP